MLLPFFQKNPEMVQSCFGHFSTCGEDIAIHHILSTEKEKGMYLDIGAFHPVDYSNTFMLYLDGWRGVNIDANRDLIGLFQQWRPEDIAVHALVSDRVEPLRYLKFSEPSINGVHAIDNIEEHNKTTNSQQQIVGSETIYSRSVKEILETYIGSTKFDLLNIDVEGMESKLLASINFDRFRPKVICIEADIENSWLVNFLRTVGYARHAHYFHTSIFVREYC